MPENEIVEVEKRAPLATVDSSSEVGAMIQAAILNKVPVESMERLFALYERMNAIKAKQAYGEAMAKFREQCPAIPRNSDSSYAKDEGVKVRRSYASLDDIQKIIDPILAANGLHYRWGDTAIDDKGILRQACTVCHSGGHEESSYFTVPTESKAGMSAAQKYASAGTYARRYSLVAVLGLRYCEPDTDAAAESPLITEADVKQLEAALAEVNADVPKFLDYMEVKAISEIRADRLPMAWAPINRKRTAKK